MRKLIFICDPVESSTSTLPSRNAGPLPPPSQAGMSWREMLAEPTFWKTSTAKDGGGGAAKRKLAPGL